MLVNEQLQAWDFSIRLTLKQKYFPENKYYCPLYTIYYLKWVKTKVWTAGYLKRESSLPYFCILELFYIVFIIN